MQLGLLSWLLEGPSTHPAARATPFPACQLCGRIAEGNDKVLMVKPSARMRSEGYCSRPVCVCVCVSVCQCVQASHPLLTQLQDQVDIPMDSVSCSLAFFV